MGNMATPAGDLYGLGIIAYEALVGRRPFSGATQVDIAFAHVNEEVPALPDAVPPQVQAIILKLLAKKPSDRPHSAREVARALDRAVVNLPTDAWDPREALSWESTGRRGPQTRELPQPAAVRPGRHAAQEPTPSRTARHASGRSFLGLNLLTLRVLIPALSLITLHSTGTLAHAHQVVPALMLSIPVKEVL